MTIYALVCCDGEPIGYIGRSHLLIHPARHTPHMTIAGTKPGETWTDRDHFVSTTQSAQSRDVTEVHWKPAKDKAGRAVSNVTWHVRCSQCGKQIEARDDTLKRVIREIDETSLPHVDDMRILPLGRVELLLTHN